MNIEYYFVTGIFYAYHNYLFSNNARVQICAFLDTWQYKRGDLVLEGMYTSLRHTYKVDDDVPNEVKIALDDLYKKML